MSNEPFRVPKAATWLWYLEYETSGVALDASCSPGPIASELSHHFAEVRVLREDQAALEEVRSYGEKVGDRPYTLTLGELASAPLAEGSIDCIAVHDRFARPGAGTAETIDSLTRLRHLLKPGGWLVAGSPVPPLLGTRPGADGGLSPRAFSRMLAAAHYRELRRVFVSPSIDDPLAMIPDSRESVSAYEDHDSIRGSTRWTRRVTAGLGLRDRLYPAYFVMARP